MKRALKAKRLDIARSLPLPVQVGAKRETTGSCIFEERSTLAGRELFDTAKPSRLIAFRQGPRLSKTLQAIGKSIAVITRLGDVEKAGLAAVGRD